MSTVTELACLLSSALESPQPDAQHVCGLLAQLLQLLDSPGAATELDDLICDLHGALVHAAQLSPAAEAHVRRLLAAAAEQCTAREVFTLCMSTLSQQLSSRHGEKDGSEDGQTHGPDSPTFQLFLLSTLQSCLLRIRRRPLHFLAEQLDMQLRWAARVLPCLPLGDVNGSRTAAAAPHNEAQPTAPLTAADAVGSLAGLASRSARWAEQAGGQQLSAQERQAAQQLLGVVVLQLAAIALLLPHNLEAAAAAVPSQDHTAAPAVQPIAGGRLPAMQVAAEAALALPQALLRQLAACTGSAASPDDLWQLAEGTPAQLASSGVDPADLPYLSATEAAEGAAAAACAAAALAPDSPAAPDQQQRQQQHRSLLLGVLPQAACLLLDLGAQQRSVALTLLPLCAVCRAGGAAEGQLGASSAPLEALLSTLVAIMSHNPVQLLRSCAHDAVHAQLGALGPHARLEQLRRMMQMPSTAVAAVALQRLRLEMAAAWAGEAQQQSQEQQQGQQEQQAQQQAGEEAAVGGSPWLSPEALELALPCLQQGGTAGWHDERGVLEQADVQAAALSLLRWVALREAAAPRGLLPRQAAQRLLQRDLLPLRACVQRLLQMQARSVAGEPDGSGGGSDAAAVQQQLLDGFLAVQRLDEALGCVIDLWQPASGAA